MIEETRKILKKPKLPITATCVRVPTLNCHCESINVELEYNFKIDDLLTSTNPNFNILLDPKAIWALNNIERFPKEINTCSYQELLQIPGIGVTGAKKIYSSRRHFTIEYRDLKNMGIVLKSAKYFITCNAQYYTDTKFFKKEIIERNLLLEDVQKEETPFVQMRLFND